MKKTFTTLLLLVILLCTSCQTKPAHYNAFHGTYYDNIDLPLDKTWKIINKTLNQKSSLLKNDSVSKVFVTQYHNNKVIVTLTPLTPQTTRYTVKTTRHWTGRKASARVVYNDLHYALNKAL